MFIMASSIKFSCSIKADDLCSRLSNVLSARHSVVVIKRCANIANSMVATNNTKISRKNVQIPVLSDYFSIT